MGKRKIVTQEAWLRNPRYVFYQRAYSIIRDQRAIVDFDNAMGFRDYLLSLWEKQQGLCYYTGEFMNLKGYKEKDPRACTVDRIIPDIGYVKDNLVLCCGIINRIKQDLSISELKRWVNKIHLGESLTS